MDQSKAAGVLSAQLAEEPFVKKKKSDLHIRLPQRADCVEGKESDCASVGSDPRTMSQDPASRPNL